MFLKSKQKIIAAIFILIAIFFLILSFLKIEKAQVENIETDLSKSEIEQSILIQEISEERQVAPNTFSEQELKISDSEQFYQNEILFIIDDVKFNISFAEGENLYSLMQKMKSQDLITFSGKEYSGLGFFVTEINGVSQNPQKGLYWKYFINDNPANIGISSYVLKKGDQIRWILTND
jgi:hypothetical protein